MIVYTMEACACLLRSQSIMFNDFYSHVDVYLLKA